MSIILIVGIILAIVSYVSAYGHAIQRKYRLRIISFATGAFLTYLILDLLPTLFKEDVFLDRLSTVGMVAGFGSFYLIESYMVRMRSGEQLKRDLKELHAFGLFLYHVGIGMVIVAVFEELDIVTSVLFIIPILAVIFVSSLSMRTTYMHTHALMKGILSLSPLIGIIIATTLPISEALLQTMLGIVAGSILFTILMYDLPKKGEAEPAYFLFGTVLYGLIIGLTWAI